MSGTCRMPCIDLEYIYLDGDQTSAPVTSYPSSISVKDVGFEIHFRVMVRVRCRVWSRVKVRNSVSLEKLTTKQWSEKVS